MNSKQEKIYSTEDHVNSAAVTIEERTKTWGKAENYKLAALPVAGALMGGVMKGRISLLDASKCQKLQLHLVVGVALHIWKSDTKKKKKKKHKIMGKLTSSCPALPSPTDPKNAVKNQTLLITGTSMSILTRTFAAVGHSVGFQNMIISKQWLQILKWD